jgi:hypothetical protein
MEGPSILVNEPGGPKKAGPKKLVPVKDFALGWRILLVLGWLFTVIGLLNTWLLWVPLRFGSAEYEFASVAASLDGLPVTMMGLTIALAASRAGGHVRSGGAATILLWVVAALVVAAGVLYWLNVPLALGEVTEPMVRLGIKKSMVKVTTQAVLYPAAMVYLALIGSRRTKA